MLSHKNNSTEYVCTKCYKYWDKKIPIRHENGIELVGIRSQFITNMPLSYNPEENNDGHCCKCHRIYNTEQDKNHLCPNDIKPRIYPKLNDTEVSTNNDEMYKTFDFDMRFKLGGKPFCPITNGPPPGYDLAMISLQLELSEQFLNLPLKKDFELNILRSVELQMAGDPIDKIYNHDIYKYHNLTKKIIYRKDNVITVFLPWFCSKKNPIFLSQMQLQGMGLYIENTHLHELLCVPQKCDPLISLINAKLICKYNKTQINDLCTHECLITQTQTPGEQNLCYISDQYIKKYDEYKQYINDKNIAHNTICEFVKGKVRSTTSKITYDMINEIHSYMLPENKVIFTPIQYIYQSFRLNFRHLVTELSFFIYCCNDKNKCFNYVNIVSQLALMFNGEDYMYFERDKIDQLNSKTTDGQNSNIYTIKFPGPINFNRIDNIKLNFKIDWKLFEQQHKPGNEYLIWISCKSYNVLRYNKGFCVVAYK
jgi:hypothetical protein